MKFAMCSDTHYGHDHNTHKIHTKFLKKLKQRMESLEIGYLIHCGDWASSKQDQLRRTWAMFRRELGPNIKIFTVLGNHDYWDQQSYQNKKKSYNEMLADHAQWAIDNNIHLLEGKDKFVELDDAVIFGFNGWYNQLPVNTNDKNFMVREHNSTPIDTYLNYMAGKCLDRCLIQSEECRSKNPNRKHILVTHFPSYTFQEHYRFMCANSSWMPIMAEEFDYYCIGHSHQVENWKYGANGHLMRCINPGTDLKITKHGYNAPNFVIVDTAMDTVTL